MIEVETESVVTMVGMARARAMDKRISRQLSCSTDPDTVPDPDPVTSPAPLTSDTPTSRSFPLLELTLSALALLPSVAEKNNLRTSRRGNVLKCSVDSIVLTYFGKCKANE